MNFRKIAPLSLLGMALNAGAAAQPAAATATAGNFFQVLVGLIVVLALLAATAWSLKKFGVSKLTGNATVRIVGGVSVGNRERVLVIEVADQWIVVGVTAGQINALSTMPRQETNQSTSAIPVTKTFSAWLKQTIDKRTVNDAQNS